MFGLILDFMTGMVIGIEHMTFDDEDEEDVEWAIVFHCLIIRISFVKWLPEA
jgi:hypothetical protein